MWQRPARWPFGSLGKSSVTVLHDGAVIKQQITAGDVIVVEMDMSHLLEEGRRLAELGIGAIVARGGTYEDLKKEIAQVPVIKIEMSVSDILFSLARARAPYRRIYLILYENIIFDLEMCKALLNISLTLIRYKNAGELTEILDRIEGGAKRVHP